MALQKLATNAAALKVAGDQARCGQPMLLGDPERGRLEVGARADLVLLDAGLNVRMTIVGGVIAHKAA